SWAGAARVPELDGLNVRAPTLEDAYLALIRDDTEPGPADGEPVEAAA
ncbi:MAG: hypothetical protein H7Y15_04845, partial [Pseudonocardia sp.]|nr:hypothetical protein [Pseudonocardia sp.]